MINHPEFIVSKVLQPNERLIWSGQPEAQAMVRGMGGSSGISGAMLRSAGLAVAIGLLLRLAPGPFSMLRESLGGFWVVIPALLVVPPIYYFWRAKGYADSLAYGITDKRLLVLRDGELDREFRPAQIKWVERRDRRAAPGLSDLIWEEHPLPQHGRGRTTNLIRRERSKIGFKAQPNGEELLQRIESWRRGHLDEAAHEAKDFVESRQDKRKKAPAGARSIENSTLGFSIEAPEEWRSAVRHRKIAFGKTGIEGPEKWKTPAEVPNWNVVQMKNAIDARVEVQVHEIEALNTFESLANPKVPKFLLETMQPVDQEPDFAVNGLKGFYVTRRLQGKGASEMALGETSDLVSWFQRHHVFHDGRRQFYVQSMWPEEAPEQGEICAAIVSTLKAL